MVDFRRDGQPLQVRVKLLFVADTAGGSRTESPHRGPEKSAPAPVYGPGYGRDNHPDVEVRPRQYSDGP
jgi:hypothetical protein